MTPSGTPTSGPIFNFPAAMAAAAAAAAAGGPPIPGQTPLNSIPRLQASFYRFLQGARHPGAPVPPGFLPGAPHGLVGGLPLRPLLPPSMVGHGGGHGHGHGHVGMLDSPPGKFSPFGSANCDDKIGER